MNDLKNNPQGSGHVFLPNVNPSAAVKGGLVQPLYNRAPAPMGVGYLGVQNSHGKMTGTVLKTTSFEGSVTLNNLSVYNLANDGPDQVSMQLNTVMANTTLLGSSNYSFWTQNVIIYTVTTHQLSFEDNIWNFSSPAAYLSSNAIYSSTGFVYPYPGVHIAVGPTFTVQYPFTVNLFLNASLINGRNAVYFNYSIPTIGVSGTYDQVIFNSTYGMGANYSAPYSYFEVNGFQMSPVGLPYDAELMLGGPGGGTTNSVYGVNGTMSLKYMSPALISGSGNHGKKKDQSQLNYLSDQSRYLQDSMSNSSQTGYVNVPAAYNFGTDTGETSEGMTVSWTPNAVAHLYTGPSLLYGMWNLSRSNRMQTFTGTVSPSNAFMFVSKGGMFNMNTAEWAPLSESGSYNFVLPAGMYTAAYMMSYYMPAYSRLIPQHLFGMMGPGGMGMSNNIVLQRDSMMGIYTPLFAENNAQVMNISTSGAGTPSNPYMLENLQYMPLSPLFSEINDFNFPVFAGVMLSHTSVSVVMTSMPSFYITYLPSFTSQPAFYGLPDYNYLGYWLYDVSNAVMWNNPDITGWFSAFSAGIPEGNVIMWNTYNTLVGNNTFNTMDSAMILFGGGGNTLFGNMFLNAVDNFTPLQQAATSIYGNNLALSVYASGNLIYNNYFNTYYTAYSPQVNPYNGNYAVWENSWNVSLRPASSVSMVNGVSLSGSITGGQYQGGNYWWNFEGSIPYTDGLLIYPQGDYLPLNGLMKVTNPSGNITDNSGINAAPNPAVPDTTPVTVPMFSDFVVTHWCPTYTATINIPSGNWASIVLVYNGSASGVVYDSAYSLVMNNVTVFTGTSPEYGNWSVQSNLTQYESILSGSVQFTFSPPMAIINGSFNNSMELLLYPVAPGAKAPSEPNMVIPFSSMSTVTVPSNVTAADLNLYVYGFGADEFWYADMPSIQPYRAINVTVDGLQIANVLPFPYINTGGIDNFMWRPVTGVFTLNDHPYSVNVTGALGMMEGTHNMGIQVMDSAGSWTTNGALLLYTSNTTGPAIPISYTNGPATPITIATPALGGIAYLTEASSNYSYSSVIPTSTGFIYSLANGLNSFINIQQFSSDGVWQNITMLESSLNFYFTQYINNGAYTNVTTVTTSLYGLGMDTGATFVTSNTTYPMTGTYTQFVQNLDQEWLQESETEVQTGTGISLHGSILESAAQGSGIFAGNLTLTSPYAGVINSVDYVATQMTSSYFSATFNATAIIHAYTHIITAVTDNAQPPYYQANITEDNIWVIQDVSLLGPP